MKEGTSPGLLVIMAKEPVPGRVKTRLVPPLSPEQAAGLYRCFLQDRIEEVRALEGIDLALAYSPDGAGGVFESLSTGDFRLFPQQGDDLGERLDNIFSTRLEEGYRAVVVTGSDSPDLPNHLLCEAFRLLLTGESDAVFGPCSDGGYYLVGLRKKCRGLFSEIPWSTPAVLSASVRNARAMGLETTLLHSWHDIDTFEDLRDFQSRLREMQSDASRAGRKTAAFLRELEEDLLR